MTTTRFSCRLTTCFILLGFTCGRCLASETSDFIARVEASPGWARLNEDELKKHAAEIDKLGRDFQSFSVEEVRDIVTELQKRASLKKEQPGEPIDSMSRVYVLLRFYYDVPEYEDKKKVKFFGGWVGIKEREERFNILFPLSKDDDGSLHTTGAFQGYMGPGYNAVSESDFFNRRYGPRIRTKR
jgi:hypothetical protein